MVDVSWSSVFFESASRRGRAYLNEPTIEIHARAFLASRSVDNFAFNLYNSGVYRREKKEGWRSLFLAPTFRVSPFLFSFFFPLVLVLSSRGRGTQQVKTTGFSSVRQPPVQWIGTWRGAGLGLR